MKHLSWILLGVWLIAYGASPWIGSTFNGWTSLLQVAAVVVGIVLIVAHKTPKKNVGTWALGSWLALWGLFALIDLSFKGQTQAMALLAIVAGVLVIIRR